MKILILAFVQGITEFLPVSSSGHVAILKRIFDLNLEAGPALEVLLHAGTLASVLVFYWRKISALSIGCLRRDAQAIRYAAYLILATFPAVVAYSVFGEFFESIFDKAFCISIFLIFTGLLLLSTKAIWNRASGKVMGGAHALLVGCAQAVAVLPGVSRSGSTISAAKWLGISTEEAFEFSFLMSVPVLLGGIVLKLKDMSSLAHDLGDGGILTLIAAFVVSAVTGYASLKIVVKCGVAGKFWLFGIYCLAAGVISSIVIVVSY